MATGKAINPTVKILYLPLFGRCGDRRVVRGFARVRDDAFGRSLAEHIWFFDGNYPTRNAKSPERKRSMRLHNIVFAHYYGPVPPGKEIDHIDRDKLNSVPENLRALAPGQNRVNINRRRDNKSGFVGVRWNKRDRTWRATTRVGGRNIFLGNFQSAKDAAVAVNRAYAQHYKHVPIPNKFD